MPARPNASSNQKSARRFPTSAYHHEHGSTKVIEDLRLDAGGSTDPDGDTLTFRWWQYHEAGNVGTKVAIGNADTKVATSMVPAEPGKVLHVILEVTDDGTPSLTHYQRVEITITP